MRLDRKLTIPSFMLALALSGCMLGPDFHKPCPAPVNKFTSTPLKTTTVKTPSAGLPGKAQQFAYGENIPREWWELYHSDTLNTLIQLGLEHSPTLAAAKATLRQSQENLIAQIGSTMFPTAQLQLTGQRQRFASASLGLASGSNIFNVYNASIPVSYTLDVFGGLRRQIEVVAAQVDYQQYETLAAYLTLTSNIVTTTMRIASLEAQIKATKELIHSQSAVLEIVKTQFKLGGIAGLSVLTQQTELGQTEATLPVLESQLSQAKNSLAVLIGSYPSETMLPHFDLEKIHLPQKIPLGVPSNLVQERPDILASEALLHQASAQIGVATANLFPQFTITGTIGYTHPSISHLISSTNEVWNYSGSILTPLFNGGALMAQRRAAIDAYQAAKEQYRQVVLQAFGNVADSLQALSNDAKTLHYQKIAEVAAAKSLKISEEQYKLGGISYINLLIAEQQYQQTKINLVKAEEARYEDTAALFAALGGGWWNHSPC